MKSLPWSIVAAAVIVLSLGGCLAIEQEACPPGDSLCADGAVWVCAADGTRYFREAICPQGQCEAGRCILSPPPGVDAVAAEPSADVAESSVVDATEAGTGHGG